MLITGFKIKKSIKAYKVPYMFTFRCDINSNIKDNKNPELFPMNADLLFDTFVPAGLATP